MDKFSKSVFLIGAVMWGILFFSTLLSAIIQEHRAEQTATKSAIVATDLSKVLNDNK